jgi:23S rRNA pseudouridine2457 synthase
MSQFKYIVFNKPYNVLSQFTPEDGARSLAEFNLPKDVYAAGRLDKDSEGLLILTNDGPLIQKMLSPKFHVEKIYLAQVERIPPPEKLLEFSQGLEIATGKTLPCKVRIKEDFNIEERDPPIRFRKTVPTCWLEITLKEGKNRQVRRMTAAIGYPTLRLMRVQFAKVKLFELGLKPGEWREITRSDLI